MVLNKVHYQEAQCDAEMSALACLLFSVSIWSVLFVWHATNAETVSEDAHTPG